jgi:hypothetical protein
MPVTHLIMAILLAAGAFVLGASVAFADGSGDPAAVKNEGGKYYDKEGNPAMGQWTGPRIQGFAAIIPIAMSVTVQTAKDRVTRPPSAIPSRP